jgi:hypothetical protein
MSGWDREIVKVREEDMHTWKCDLSMFDSTHRPLQQSKTLAEMNEEAIMVMFGVGGYLQHWKECETSPLGDNASIHALVWVLVEENNKAFVYLLVILSNRLWVLQFLGCLAAILYETK